MKEQVMSDDPLLVVENLRKYFPIRQGFTREKIGDIKAVDDVSFSIHKGKPLALSAKVAAARPQRAKACWASTIRSKARSCIKDRISRG